MDADERELFAAGVRDLVARGGGAALDAALADLGWVDALDDEPGTAVAVLFEAQGAAVAASGALDLVLAQALGVDGGAVLLPPLGSTTAPGTVDGDTVRIAGLATAGAIGATEVLVAAPADGGGTELLAVPSAALVVRSVSGIDPELGLVQVTGAVARSATTSHAAGRWDGAVAAGQRALAHELVGTAQGMLDLAREHALERIQFDRPIATFQAVRHKLAEALVAVESARGALDAAWEAGTPFDAAVAKAIAGRSARLAAKHCQQVLAGIGFTAEHRFHHHLRRTRALDGLLGDARSLTKAIGEQLLAEGGLPAILPLHEN